MVLVSTGFDGRKDIHPTTFNEKLMILINHDELSIYVPSTP
jgi:hypothetical protein